MQHHNPSGEYPLYAIEVVRDYASFLHLETEWNHLLEESHDDCIFLRHEWFRLFWRHFLGEQNKAAIYTVRQREALVAVAPCWSVMGSISAMVNDHSWRYDFIYKEEAGLSALLDYWIRQAPAASFQFNLIPETSPTIQLIQKWGSRFYWYAYQSCTPPYLSIHGSLGRWGSWAGYFSKRSGHFRSNINRRERRLQEQGALSLETVASLDHLADALDDGFRIEAMAWKGEAGSAIEKSAQLVAFYAELADEAAKKGWLRLYFLKLNQKRIAFNYSLIYKKKLYLIKPGYDPAYAKDTPGHLLTKKIIQQAFEDQLIEYDFLANPERWKMDWAEGVRPDLSLHIYKKGFSPALQFFVKFGWKKILKRYGIRRGHA